MIYICYSVIFVCLVGLSYLLVGVIKKKNVFNVVAEQLKLSTNRSSKARIRTSEEVYNQVGNGDKVSFFTKLDITINLSSLKRKFTFVNAELVLLFVAFFTLIVGFITALFSHNFAFVLLACVVTIFIFYSIFFAVSDKQIKTIDDNILQFANLLHSYSNMSSDLISVFEAVAPQLEEPLKSAVNTCVAESRVDGNISAAIGRLSLKMRHRKLTELLQALEAGSKNNANYRSIIGRCYDSISIYKGEKAIRRATANGARLNILLMFFIFVLCILSLVYFLELPLSTLFFSNRIGNFMFVFCCMILIYVAWKFVTLGNK
jgi:Flp pilus assembly protein TadB